VVQIKKQLDETLGLRGTGVRRFHHGLDRWKYLEEDGLGSSCRTDHLLMIGINFIAYSLLLAKAP
jgi:hypothetical protein